MITIEEQITAMNEAQLDALPFGVIRLDRHAKILYYNAQSNIAQRAAPAIGLNFFDEVAPCAAIKDFQGRFLDFVSAPKKGLKPFDFVFRLSSGTRRVRITFVWSAQDPGSYYIVVMLAPAS